MQCIEIERQDCKKLESGPIPPGRYAGRRKDNSGGSLVLLKVTIEVGDGIKHSTCNRIWIEKRSANSINDVRARSQVILPRPDYNGSNR